MSIRLALGLSAGGVVAVLVLLWQAAISDRDHARRAAAEARTQSAVTSAAIGVDIAAAKAVQATLARGFNFTVEAKEAADDLAGTPGADTPVPPAVLAAWAGSIDRMRDQAGADSHSAAIPNAGRPDGTLSPAATAR